MKDIDKLQATANSLPKIKKTKRSKVSGSKLHEAGVYQLGSLTVDKNASYMVPVITSEYVNHFRELKRIFQHKGWPGVIDYQKQVHQTYKLQHA